jgi:hypothetical protein
VDRESYGSDRCNSVLVLIGVFKFLFLATDVDEGPITGEDPFDSDSHTDGATAAQEWMTQMSPKRP